MYVQYIHVQSICKISRDIIDSYLLQKEKKWADRKLAYVLIISLGLSPPEFMQFLAQSV